MNAITACAIAYVIALCAWAWTICTPDPQPVFTPVNIQFCQDWRDLQASLCEAIPFRKEVEI